MYVAMVLRKWSDLEAEIKPLGVVRPLESEPFEGSCGYLVVFEKKEDALRFSERVAEMEEVE